ncbi:DKNYY domain-containing protein [Aureibaculum sp. A20]|uniref:DKNYY domain-containing protein n=1 Tax=Aureibaculum flavum TaxID=2795986 RepID=A0ABS0WS64_9FLAO|nr:DKNYY domain-containing protein [Aureibaculum flavum]MBJ2174824.1 DKNYY domain-containing protein [Aureibaculum flavum]
MNVGYLSRLFPFLTLLMLLGCPNFEDRDYIHRHTSESVIDASEAADAVGVEEPLVEDALSREDKIMNTIERLDSINLALDWNLIKDKLYRNNKGQLGFQIDYATEVGNTKNYITQFCDSESTLNEIIDIKSFDYLGSTFYKDKNYIYHYFDMAYGGRFSIYSIADYNTFKVIGDHYAKDKNHIYGERAGQLKNIDYNTFTSEVGAGPYAKDKFGYYFWNELIMTHDELYKKHKRKSISTREFSKLIKN